jgi:molybdopterin-guanine dinucleotide biosynthesis protein A
MTLTAMLLVGGCSRRMGRDKSTLIIDGEPLWQRQLRVLRQVSPAALFVSARAKPLWCPPELEIILDEPPSCGPLSGLAAGLSRLQTSHLLVLAIDLPCVSASHLRKLSSLVEPGKGVIPMNQDYFEPLCAIYPAEASPLARQALSAGHLSIQHLAKALVSTSLGCAYAVAPEERPLYLNLNTPTDLQASANAP